MKKDYTKAIVSFVKETIRNPEFFQLPREEQKNRAEAWLKSEHLKKRGQC